LPENRSLLRTKFVPANNNSPQKTNRYYIMKNLRSKFILTALLAGLTLLSVNTSFAAAQYRHGNSNSFNPIKMPGLGQ